MAHKHRRGTKIVATVGPATDNCLDDLITGGVDVFRVNFSHGNAAEHRRRVVAIREAAHKQDRHVAILGDLQGPKVRITQFTDEAIELVADASFAIDTQHPSVAGNKDVVGTTYADLPQDCRVDDVLVLGDGLIELEVTDVTDTRVSCRVLTGGTLGGGKGINKRGGGLSAAALTAKDEQDIQLAADLAVDYLAVSFPRNADDMLHARHLMQSQGLDCGLVAKIERAEAVASEFTLDAIIEASDAVMIARGDLGIEIGYAALMGVQKRIARRARKLNRTIITATQMMESMIHNPSPTRAEVLDVANAVLDGTDAVMLSGETAVGNFPVETVEAVARVIEGAEQSSDFQAGSGFANTCHDIDESIALASVVVALRLDGVRAIACFTTSGNTPKLMSRYLTRIPIYAMVENERTLGRVALYRGVVPVFFKPQEPDYDRMNLEALAWLKSRGAVGRGDRVILSKGDLRKQRTKGGTNTMKVIVVD